MNHGLEGRNEMEREGLQELGRRRQEAGQARSMSRGLGPRGHTLAWAGS